jgi:septal ring factor EnvC (AmiA/AmiB activator)
LRLAGQRQQRLGTTVLSVALWLCAGALAAAQNQDVVDKDDAVQTLEQRQQGLEETHERQKELEGDLVALGKERDALNRELIITASAIQESEEQLTGLERELQDLATKRRLLQGNFTAQTKNLRLLLMVLQRMGNNPPPAMITQRKDALEMVRSAMMLATIFPNYRNEALALKHQLDNLDRVIADETAQRDKIATEREKLSREQARIDPLIEAKQLAIAETEKQLAGVRELAKAQARGVVDIRDLIRKLDKEIADRTKLGAYETELAEAVLAGKRAQSETKVAAADPAATSLPQTDGAAGQPLAADVAFLDPGRLKPAIPFDQAKGRLPLPVRGERILSFGQQTRSGSKSKGVAFATREQAQITAPCDGWVVYAGEFRSYDQVLIINAGGGYHLLLAGMAQINVQVGQFVLSGEPVGKMGGARKAAEGSASPAPPILYLELRSKERPVNPDPWWGPGGQKVANG